MGSEETAATIAFFGVLISAAISWAVARQSAATELQKQKLQLFQAYAEKLQEHRLASYPVAYKLISSCAKEIHRGTLTFDYLKSTLKQFQEWDSSSSLLLSQRAANFLFEAQWDLDDLLKQGPDALKPVVLGEIAYKMEQMELVLKEDIGVFAVEYEDNRKLDSYVEYKSPSPRTISTRQHEA